MHPSPNQESKKDGATPQRPYLTAPGVSVEDAVVILDEITLPYNRQITLTRALPAKGQRRFNVVCGEDVKVQTLRVLRDVPAVAEKVGRAVKVVQEEIEIPVEGVRLDATSTQPARQIESGVARLNQVSLPGATWPDSQLTYHRDRSLSRRRGKFCRFSCS